MWLLAVDSSSKDASVALLRDDRLVALVAPRSDEQHSVALFRHIQAALREAGIKLKDIDAYAVASGPGAFTGLRIGLALVKALAEMHARPVVPVSVLEAVCASANAQGCLAPVVNAYRGQVFAAVYEKRDTEPALQGRERVLILPEFLQQLEADSVQPESCTFVSPNLDRWAEPLAASAFGASRRESISPVLAEAVAQRARRKLSRGEAVDALHLQANYVRRSDAELLWKPK
jgi:tRNA threonylcarbamoyladenosine biosynthesis protein TsaB